MMYRVTLIEWRSVPIKVGPLLTIDPYVHCSRVAEAVTRHMSEAEVHRLIMGGTSIISLEPLPDDVIVEGSKPK
jgi:hypothetical protein